MTPLAGDDFDSGHHVVHDGVVDLFADQPLDLGLAVDAQQVDQELDGAALVKFVFISSLKNDSDQWLCCCIAMDLSIRVTIEKLNYLSKTFTLKATLINFLNNYSYNYLTMLNFCYNYVYNYD